MEYDKKIMEVIRDNCKEIGTEYLELGLDALLDEETLKNIPVVNTVYTMIKLPLAIRNAYSIKKLIYFCYYMNKIPSTQRAQYVNKAISKDKDFGEKLLVALDRIDDLDKIEMLKKLFQAYGHRDGISYDDFRRLVIILEKVYVGDLKYLKEVYNKEHFGGTSAIALVAAGLATETIINANLHCDTDENYSLNSIGKLFYCCVFTDKYDFIV